MPEHRGHHQGWGDTATKPLLQFWDKTLDTRYSGLEGQRRLWLITVTILERDTIRYRLADLHCPIWIIHGEKDIAIPVAVVEEQFSWLTGVDDKYKKIEIVKGGTHYLTQSKPEECKKILLDLVRRYS
jgi:pimeloyl-ACP methyl ester carboxylesterase